jgi:hypothetical protein
MEAITCRLRAASSGCAAQLVEAQRLVLDQVEDQRLGLAVEAGVEEVAQPLAHDRLALERRLVDEGLARLVDLDRPHARQAAEQRHDRGVGEVAGELPRVLRPHLRHRPAAQVPEHLHHVELGRGQIGQGLHSGFRLSVTTPLVSLLLT